jgi:lipopolysaccharide biosynthesis protein
MFWAKTNAIYQIFRLRIKYPEELGQPYLTIMHAIGRTWLYLVKLNGFYYKTTLKNY